MLRNIATLSAATVAVLALGFCQGSAQETSVTPKSVPRTSDSTALEPLAPDPIYVRSDLVMAPVSVTDSSGEFVDDLGEEEFRVWDDGVAQQITYFGMATAPVIAVILIQVNREVAHMLPDIHPLGSLLSNLLLGKSGEAAVVTYADRPEIVQTFSNDPDKLSATLSNITSRMDGARLNDALIRAVSLLSRQSKAKRRVVVVFSEGFDRGSATSGAEVVRAASIADVTIYGIRFNPTETKLKEDGRSTIKESLGPCPANLGFHAHPCNFAINLAPLAVLAATAGSRKLNKNLLGQYGAYTGGFVYTQWKQRALQDQLQDIALAVRDQYDLAYVPTHSTNTGFHPLKIAVTDPGLRVRTRVGYFYTSGRK